MAMLAMMPDDIAVMIYKEVFRSSLNIINKPKTQREYGFAYQRMGEPPVGYDLFIEVIIKYLNEYVIQEPSIFYDEDGDEIICMEYYVIGNDGEKILISRDQYDEDYDLYYRYVKDSLRSHKEISKEVVKLALRLSPANAAKLDTEDYTQFMDIINTGLARNNLRLRLSWFEVPDTLPIEYQAFLMGRQPKDWKEGELFIHSKH